jgi:hypothetical protein
MIFHSTYVTILSEGMHHKFLDLLFDKIAKTKDLETKWYNTLMNMPNAVTLYTVNSKEIVFHNKLYEPILGEFIKYNDRA